MKKIKNIFAKFKPKKQTHFAKLIKETKKGKFTWRLFWLWVLYVSIGLFFISIIMFAWFAKDLPTPSKIASRKLTESTKLYDRTGKTLLYETGEEKRTIVDKADISQYLKDATVATEDANFYTHHGFDSEALAKAVFEKITGRRTKARGASTVTQQYVKNALLTSDRSVIRKFKELILSIELEFMYKKDDILAMYLNEIPYGNSTAGAEAASKMYFGVSAKDLTISQAATLAAIPQAPTYYSPYGTHTKELVARKNYVLDRMVTTGKITKEQAESAKNTDDLALGTTLKPRRDSMQAPHFSMYVLEKVAEQYGEDVIQKEGLKIVTTIDLDKQKKAEESITENVAKLTKNNASNASVTAIDPKTGQILAMVGSKDYFDTTIDGNVNVADSLRQPGSSWKPIVYATLFKNAEYSPSKVLFDVQTDFGNYTPKNFSGNFSGPIDIRHALGNSLNIPAVKAASLAGIDNIIKTAQDMGITTLTNRDQYGLSFGLGVAEVKPVEMAGAFSVFANGGIKHDVRSVLKITEANGKVIYEYNQEKDKGREVLDPQLAYEIANMMSDNNSRTSTFGAHSALYFPERTVAAKTGTTSDNKDGWTMGYTPSLVTAVWVGNNTPTPMKNDAVVLAGPIFHSFMDKALKDVANEDFVRPQGITELTVEKFSNKLPGDGSKEFITDIFASWQVPKDKDSVNISAKICLGTNKLAPADFPAELTESRIYTNLHSERPDFPNWENPVRAWASAAGMANLPPTDYCQAGEVNSSVSITAPAADTKVAGETEIQASVQSAASVSNIEFFIDNTSIGKVSNLPYSISYDFNTLEDGRHQITAVATLSIGTTVRSNIDVTVEKTTAPLAISNLKALREGTKVTISWTTNKPSSTQIGYKTEEEDSYTMSTVDPTLTLNHSVVMKNIPSGSYLYRAISVDAENNSVTSTERSF